MFVVRTVGTARSAGIVAALLMIGEIANTAKEFVYVAAGKVNTPVVTKIGAECLITRKHFRPG
jgi:hypothetical protein